MDLDRSLGTDVADNQAFDGDRALKRQFKIGDRVKLSGLGRERFCKTPDRAGEIVGISATEASYRIRWDGRRSIDPVHWSFIEHDLDWGTETKR